MEASWSKIGFLIFLGRFSDPSSKGSLGTGVSRFFSSSPFPGYALCRFRDRGPTPGVSKPSFCMEGIAKRNVLHKPIFAAASGPMLTRIAN